MSSERPEKPSFWNAVRLLLGVARKRAAGRRKRQQELLGNRTGRSSADWGGIGFAFAVLFMVVLNVLAGLLVSIAVDSGQRLESEGNRKIVVSRHFLRAATIAARASESAAGPADRSLVPLDYFSEAREIAHKYGGDGDAIEHQLQVAFQDHGARDFIAEDQASPGLMGLAAAGRLTAMLGSCILLCWGLMLVCQGEGLELDLQRRRDPMWEWVFSHPVPPGAIFLAEMLSPIAANPVYWGAPLFTAVVYGFVYGPLLGFAAAVLVGIPVTIAAACVGKALEIGVVLRFSSRTRGALVGIMSWVGYVGMMMFFLGFFVLAEAITALARFLSFFTFLPWPWLRWFVGGQLDGSFSFVSGMISCWTAAAITVALAVRFSVWATQQGLSGNFAADSAPSPVRSLGTRFGREPLYRKEFLWFIRDRSAIVQAILIPLTIASVELFNLRGLLPQATGTWNYLCGAAILFGTYFLWIAGPKSLASEGNALWIPLTWPRGLESMLKSKAWLWSIISSVIVVLVLCYAAFLFPAQIWKVAVVGVGWFFFGRSMSQKSVTLVSVASSSGEQEGIPWGRRGAAQLGMLTFSIGVITQQWQTALMGVVYSYLTAAAMWENFRARLPYLYDPWSETLPPPPTVMHAMIAISILVEGGAVATGLVLVFAGRENIPLAQAISYGICATLVSLGTAHFLESRGVTLRDVWVWQRRPFIEAQRRWRDNGSSKRKLLLMLLVGAGGGLVLGLFAHAYIAVLSHLPATSELLRRSQEQMAKIPNLKICYAIMAVGFAPFAEEYLFGGLLFRALDREWGGWRAVVGSAAFFAMYHAPMSWVPVALLGASNAILFKKTGRLAPAVVLHMVYNAVVLI